MSSTAKATSASIAAVITIIAVILAGVIGVGFAIFAYFMINEAANNRECDTSTPGQTAIPTVETAGGLTVKNVKISADQLRNASIIVATALKLDLPPLAAGKIALMTAIQESTLVNVPFGDRDSVGLFQQRTPWGTYKQRMNPRVSSEMFFLGGKSGYSEPGLTDIEGWESMEPGVAAQSVQISAYPDAYADHEAEAQAIVQAIVTELGAQVTVDAVTAVTGVCESETDPIELAVRAALSKVGSTYDWKQSGAAYDGASFLSWAAGEADFELPSTIGELATFEGNPESGVSARFIPAGPNFEPERGNILLYSSNPLSTDPQDAIRSGFYLGKSLDEVAVATYNTGPGPGMDRRAAELKSIMNAQDLDIVGLQETEVIGEYREVASRSFLGSRYAIYPARATRMHRNSEETRPIIYDQTRFEVVKSDILEFRRMGPERIQPGEGPIVWLKDKISGQTLIFANTHNPAYARYAKERAEAAKYYVDKFEQLRSEGLPMIFAGDFNEGTAVRKPGMGANITYRWGRPDAHRHLFYCKATSNMLFKAVGRTGSCPNPPARTAVDFIYISPEMKVLESGKVEDVLSDHPLVYATVSGPRSESQSSSDGLGDYVGANPKTGVIGVKKASRKSLIGAIELSISEPEVETIAAEGEWRPPMMKGSYYLPSTSGGMYGWRIHPVTGANDFHNGIDLAASTGQPVYSIGAGRVIQARYDSCWGNLVIVDHGDYLSMYTHLSSFGLGVQPGFPVIAGQQIGEVGNTGGCSAGSHLHFTIGTSLEILAGEARDSVDPAAFLRAQGIVL